MVVIVTSVQDSFAYYDNLGFLRNEVANGNIAFQGVVNNYPPEGFVFNSNRTYDFTLSAKARVREDMVDHLYGVLPGLQEQDKTRLREAFGCIFDYYWYKEYLSMVGQQRGESMHMMLFNDRPNQDGGQYSAHIHFSSTTTRDAFDQFTVHATITCQRFDFFPMRQTAFADVLQALQNLHV